MIIPTDKEIKHIENRKVDTQGYSGAEHEITKIARILLFSAYALFIFTEYTAWATFGEMSKSERRFSFFLFTFLVISQWEQICKWGIKYAHSVMTNHVGSTSITTHIPSFINVARTELWIFNFFVNSQSEQVCKWGIKYVHSVTTNHMGSTCAPYYLHTKFDENRSLPSC